MTEVFTPDEQIALKQFRLNIEDVLDKYDEYDSSDKNLIRWLRARDLNVQKSEHMLRKSVKYREDNDDVQQLKYLQFSEELLEKFPFRFIGHDRQGALVLVIPAGVWEIKAFVQAGRSREINIHISQIFERYFHYMKSTYSVESMRTLKVVLILDLQHFSIQQNASKPVVSYLYELTRLLDANYPEFMKSAYIINVPSLFAMLWTIVKPFLAQRTLEKVRIIRGGRDNWRKALLENIDSRDLPAEYGGSRVAHPNFSDRDGEELIPHPRYYNPEEYITTTVPAKQKFVTSFNLSVGDSICWSFKTDAHNVGFEITQNGVRMFPYLMADANIFVQEGFLDVIQAGTYCLAFDNTHSKYRAKTLHYSIRIDENVNPKG